MEGSGEQGDWKTASKVVLAGLSNLDRRIETEARNGPGLDTNLDSEDLRALETNLSSTLLKIRRAVNAAARINRLPRDVLKLIFEYLLPPALKDFFTSRPDSYPVTTRVDGGSPQLHLSRWLRILSVCHHWRDVASSTATMWSTISIGPAHTPNSIFDMQLALCRDAPLDLHLSQESIPPEMYKTRTFDFSQLDFRPLVPRLRSLHLHARPQIPKDVRTRFFDSFTVPAPLLEHLTIYPANVGWHWNIPNGDNARVEIALPTLFEDSIPRLRTLTIGGFTSWPGNHFRNLTRLCLRDQCETRHPQLQGERSTWPLSMLLNLFEDSPLLEDLVIDNALPLILDSRPKSPLSLPHLRSLTLRAWPTETLQLFLSTLVIPELCRVQLDSATLPKLELIEAICDPDYLSNLTACLSNITRVHLHAGRHAVPSDLSILGCGDSGIHITGRAAPNGANWPDGAGLQAVHIHLQNGVPVAPPAPEPYTKLPVSDAHGTRLYSAMNVKELWIDSYGLLRVPAEGWHSLFDALPHVERLVVVSKANKKQPPPTYDCLEALAARACWPNLSEIVVIFQGAVIKRVYGVLKRVQDARLNVSFQPAELKIGAKPDLKLSEDDLENLRTELGPETGLVDASATRFDQRPFTSEDQVFSESGDGGTWDMPAGFFNHHFGWDGVVEDWNV